jgi:acetyl-CoA acetyltransferase
VSNPDAVTRLVGLTGITFTNVFNACATSASAIQQTADTIRLGKYDIGIAVGLDKHPRGAFTDDPAKLALPQWYAQNGQFVTTKFFGIKANRYIHDHNISEETLARRQQELPQRCAEPECVPPQGDLHRRDHGLAGAELPLRQYMFCAPDEGAGAVIMCRADIAHRYTDKPVYVRASEIRTRRSAPTRCTPRRRRWKRTSPRRCMRPRRRLRGGRDRPEDVDIAQLQDTDAGAEIIHMAETGLRRR